MNVKRHQIYLIELEKNALQKKYLDQFNRSAYGRFGNKRLTMPQEY
jgi:hypothetical protein